MVRGCHVKNKKNLQQAISRCRFFLLQFTGQSANKCGGETEAAGELCALGGDPVVGLLHVERLLRFTA